MLGLRDSQDGGGVLRDTWVGLARIQGLLITWEAHAAFERKGFSDSEPSCVEKRDVYTCICLSIYLSIYIYVFVCMYIHLWFALLLVEPSL